MYVYKLFLRMPVQPNENIKVALMFMNDCITCLSILNFNCQYSLVVRLSKTKKYTIQYTGRLETALVDISCKTEMINLIWRN